MKKIALILCLIAISAILNAQITPVDLGTPNGHNGTPIRTAFGYINSNVAYIDSCLNRGLLSTYFISKEGTKYVGTDIFARTVTRSTSMKTILRAAVNSVSTGGTIYIKQASYTMDSIVIQKYVRIIGVGNVNFTWTTTTGFQFYFLGTIGSAIATTTTTTYNTDSIRVASTPAAVIGDLIQVYDDSLWIPDLASFNTMKTGELHKIIAINGGKVMTEDNFIHSYLTTRNARIRIIKPLKVYMENINILGTDSSTACTAVVMQYCTDSEIIKCKTDRVGYSGFIVSSCYNTTFDKHEGNRCLNSNGYAISIGNFSAHTKVFNSNFTSNWNGVAHGGANGSIGQPRGTVIFNCIFHQAYSTNAGVDAHGMVEDMTVQLCEFHGISTGYVANINMGARVNYIYDNVFYGGYSLNPSSSGGIGNSYFIYKNKLYNCTRALFYYSTDNDKINNVELVGNYVEGKTSWFIKIKNAKKFKIGGNTYITPSVRSGGFQSNNAIELVSCRNGKIYDNNIDSVYLTAIHLTSCYDIQIYNNTLKEWDVRDVTTAYPAIDIINSTYINIYENTLIKVYKSYLHSLGIRESGSSDYNIFEHNDLRKCSDTEANRLTIIGVNSVKGTNYGYTL